MGPRFLAINEQSVIEKALLAVLWGRDLDGTEFGVTIGYVLNTDVLVVDLAICAIW